MENEHAWVHGCELKGVSTYVMTSQCFYFNNNHGNTNCHLFHMHLPSFIESLFSPWYLWVKYLLSPTLQMKQTETQRRQLNCAGYTAKIRSKSRILTQVDTTGHAEEGCWLPPASWKDLVTLISCFSRWILCYSLGTLLRESSKKDLVHTLCRVEMCLGLVNMSLQLILHKSNAQIPQLTELIKQAANLF